MRIFSFFTLLVASLAVSAQVTLSPIPQGFVGNSGASSAPPASITPQQAATLVQPYIAGGGGLPWINAASPGIGGCAGVVSGQDAKAALQCQIDALFAGPKGSGTIVLPVGDFPISGTVIIKGGVTLLGSGIRATMIQTTGDFLAFRLDTSISYGGFRDIWVLCSTNSNAVENCVRVDPNVPVILKDSWIWGGKWALDTAGVDGLYTNLYINGWGTDGGGIKSTGSNWYIRNKVNAWPQATNVGFYQGVTGGTGVSENHISQSDFSGPYQLSIYVADGGANTSVLTIDGSVFSAPISLPNHNTTILIGNELGESFLYAGPGNLIAVGNRAFVPVTVTGPGARSCAANVNIAC